LARKKLEGCYQKNFSPSSLEKPLNQSSDYQNDVNPFAQGWGWIFKGFFFLVWNSKRWLNEEGGWMDKENEKGGWKNHSSGIGVTHKVVFLDKSISWITQITKEIHSHTLEGD